MLAYDPEWLAITRAFNGYMSLERRQSVYPDEAPAREAVTKELAWVKENLLKDKDGDVLKVEDVQQFSQVAPGPANDEPRTPRESARIASVDYMLTNFLACSSVLPKPTDSGILHDVADRKQGRFPRQRIRSMN